MPPRPSRFESVPLDSAEQRAEDEYLAREVEERILAKKFYTEVAGAINAALDTLIGRVLNQASLGTVERLIRDAIRNKLIEMGIDRVAIDTFERKLTMDVVYKEVERSLRVNFSEESRNALQVLSRHVLYL